MNALDERLAKLERLRARAGTPGEAAAAAAAIERLRRRLPRDTPSGSLWGWARTPGAVGLVVLALVLGAGVAVWGRHAPAWYAIAVAAAGVVVVIDARRA